MSKTVEELEEELRQTKRKNAENNFLDMMKEIKAIPTEYKCKLCGGQIYRHDHKGSRSTASCLCNSHSSWSEHPCKICGTIVEVVVSYYYHDGHRGHTVEQGKFEVVPFTNTTPKTYFNEVLICNECMQLKDLEWRKQVKDQEKVVDGASSKITWKKKEIVGAKSRVRKFEEELKALVETHGEEAMKLVELKSQGDLDAC